MPVTKKKSAKKKSITKRAKMAVAKIQRQATKKSPRKAVMAKAKAKRTTRVSSSMSK